MDTALRYVMFHYTTLNYTVFHYAAILSTTLHYTILNYTVFHYAAILSTTLHYTTLHYTTLHYTPLHSTPLHSTPLHSTPLHYTTLHSIILQGSSAHLENFTSAWTGAWENWDAARASHESGAPTPLQKPYKYMKIFYEHFKKWNVLSSKGHKGIYVKRQE
jgi:hypothetical protein